MASTNKTPLFNLNQWIETDTPKRIDFNNDNLNIENAIKRAIQNITYNTSNGNLSLIKLDNTSTTVNLISESRVNSLIDSKVTDTRIKEQAYIKMQEYGIGRNDAENYNLDTNLLTGLYVKREYRDFGNKTSGIVNFQYNSKWGVQLGMTSDDVKPTLYLRAKRNNTLTSWKEIATVDTVNEILNREVQRATFTEIWSGLND